MEKRRVVITGIGAISPYGIGVDVFWDGVKNAYTLGEENKGGGAIGAIVAIALVKLMGTMGTLIASAGVAVVLLVFILLIFQQLFLHHSCCSAQKTSYVYCRRNT